jgi:hypothetical protein
MNFYKTILSQKNLRVASTSLLRYVGTIKLNCCLGIIRYGKGNKNEKNIINILRALHPTL